MAFIDKLKSLGRFVVQRAQEPSTWAAVASIGALAHANPEVMSNVGNAAPLVAAILGVFLPESQKQ
ncbi:hypothetical protein HQ393_04655 [Chitinibacter bivalviorum]|uniref:Uncharacterized protein n=1 Tax=Chitinibacter bivalviorum TaxID=2739434 RepID=A0A7H9BGR0_9NEIS|nr:hypothetical protein [Chitinibacter bivalviorum]QLG87602.1 hypothetical protein HQ393_04655 [Chitinibacter bivalviorum]